MPVLGWAGLAVREHFLRFYIDRLRPLAARRAPSGGLSCKDEDSYSDPLKARGWSCFPWPPCIDALAVGFLWPCLNHLAPAAVTVVARIHSSGLHRSFGAPHAWDNAEIRRHGPLGHRCKNLMAGALSNRSVISFQKIRSIKFDRLFFPTSSSARPIYNKNSGAIFA